MPTSQRLWPALLLFVIGWLFIAHQHQRQWARLPVAATVQRYAPDAVATPLPAPMPVAELRRLCAAPPSWLARRVDRIERAELAACLAQAQTLPAEAVADAARHYAAQLAAQARAARAWLAAHAEQAPHDAARLGAELKQLQHDRPGLAGLLPASDVVPREAIGPRQPPEAIARLADVPIPPASSRDEVLALGLRAAGKQLQLDYGHSPPTAHFASDRATLADALEWRRRAQAHAQRGFSLQRLHGLPDMLLASGAVLLLAALLAGGPLLPWVAAVQLLACGGLVLTDLALTGDPTLRYLVERQFFALGSGERWLDLSLGLAGVRLWWPLLVLAGLVLALSRLRTDRLLAPLSTWVRAGAQPRHGAAQTGLLLLLGVAAVLGLGLPAAVSEWLTALGCIGLASYFARQAGFANAGGGLDAANLVVALGALAVAVCGAVYRGDLGHALVALALGVGFFALFGGRGVRVALLIALALAAGLLLALRFGPEPEALAWLPAHAQDRLLAMVDPYHAPSSDLARTRWLMHSAGLTGWGTGLVPWQGLAPDARAVDGLPLQGPSDYVLALAVATWGQLGGLALLAAALALFAWAAIVAACTALRPGQPPALRWLAALGLFGCAVMAVKILLSLGGVAGVLPLTGLPVALLGYGPVGHLAALFYLALALGTANAPGRLEPAGVRLHAAAGLPGLLRRRGAALAGAALLGVSALLALALLQMRLADPQHHHLAQARFALADATTRALLPAGPAEDAAVCPALLGVQAAWHARLADRQLRLDLPTLLAQPAARDAAVSAGACRRLARALGGLLQAGLAPIAGPGRPAVAARDFTSSNAWWGLPGCVAPLGASAPACQGLDAVAPLLRDLWLQRELAPRLQAGITTPTGTRELHGRRIATGPQLGLSLDPALQANAQRIADCFTARRRDCDDALPRDAGWRQRFFDEKRLRSAAIGLVMAEVDTGRIVALAGSLSDCALDALGRSADPGPQGRRAALRPGASQPCSQYPDRGSAYLALQAPALWAVPPGSALKPLAMLAAIDAGHPADDAGWKRILAESHDHASVQRAALEAGPRYVEALARIGFADARSELLWGGDPALGLRWRFGLYEGLAGLRAPQGLSFADMSAIRREKEAGRNADRRHGAAVMTEYLAARRLADSSIGSADMRLSALGLVDLWRRLDLRARGRAEAPALHLLELAGQPVAQIALDFGSPDAARRALAAAGGVSASAWKGTAQGACRVVMGGCPAEGLPGLVGKTGTSDFLTEEDGPWVKPGLALPAKLFGGVFVAPDGRRYAVAAMALRVREGATLELRSSAAAEAALTLLRQLN